MKGFIEVTIMRSESGVQAKVLLPIAYFSFRARLIGEQDVKDGLQWDTIAINVFNNVENREDGYLLLESYDQIKQLIQDQNQ